MFIGMLVAVVVIGYTLAIVGVVIAGMIRRKRKR